MRRIVTQKNRKRVLLVLLIAAALAILDRTPRSDESGTHSGVVVSVPDGDSLVVRIGRNETRVRLFGIDAPEKGQDFANRSRRFASDLASGEKVTLQVHGKDQYERLLAEVILPDGRSLNREMVKEGFAWWYENYAREDRELEAFQEIASASRIGLWLLPNPVPPWEFRRQNRNRE